MVKAVFDLDQCRYRSPPVGATLRRFLGSIEPAPQEPLAVGKMMRRVTECVVLMIALTAMAQPAPALSYLSCSTRKVAMISAPSGDTSSTREEAVAFVIDETTKTLTFTDNRPLTVKRLDEYWINPVSHPFGSTASLPLQCGTASPTAP